MYCKSINNIQNYNNYSSYQIGTAFFLPILSVSCFIENTKTESKDVI